MNGPPERRESRPAGNQGGDLSTRDKQNLTVPEAVRQWKRGRSLLSCGHTGDPYRPCRRCEPVTYHQAEAAVIAVEHLDSHGLPALLDPATCRAIHRAGYRALAEAVHRRNGGV